MASQSGSWRVGQRIAPPRFILFVVVLVAASAGLLPWLSRGRAVMAGFDLAAAVFLASVSPLLDNKPAEMRHLAQANDANRAGLLAVVGLVLIVVLVAVANELMGKGSKPTIILVVATLVLAWLFSNTIYALHYAHLFYSDDAGGKDQGGLDFPSCQEPGYWDFIYFSFTLGMTFQTSDVEMTTTRMRRVATGHCLLAFIFNLGVLAFTINVLGGGS